jgi:putative peptide zinc metalloprotease protein
MTVATSLQAIRRDIKFTPHLQGEDVWYAVEDPSTGRFIRLGHHEYLAAIHLDGHRDADQIIASAKSIEPAFQLSDREITTLAGWLSGVGFLQTPQNLGTGQSSTPHSSRIVWDPLNARFPLLSGQWVEALARILQPLTSSIATVIVFVLSICAAVALFANWEDYWTVSQKLFVAEGRIWWIVAWLLLKVVHECGHAVTAVRAGSQIRSAGISFIFFAPVPYIDVSDLWSISNRWHRILCSAGGMLFEVAVSAVAVFVALTAESESLRYFSCAVATTGTITTLLFNGNPFVRFDGYYILADLVQKPNLWVDGQRAASGCIQKVITPWKRSVERFSLAIVAYGLVCWANRIITLVGLAMWALLVWQEIGYFMVAWAGYAWFVVPWWKSTKAECARNQMSTNKMLVSSRVWTPPLTIAFLLLLAYVLPSPIQPNVPGIVDFEEPNVVRSECEGFLAKVYVDELKRCAAVRVGCQAA